MFFDFDTLPFVTARSEEGRAFIRERIRVLEERKTGHDLGITVRLALYWEKLGDNHLEKALQLMDNAITAAATTTLLQGNRASSCDAGEVDWARSERARLSKAYQARVQREAALASAKTLPTGNVRKRRREDRALLGVSEMDRDVPRDCPPLSKTRNTLAHHGRPAERAVEAVRGAAEETTNGSTVESVPDSAGSLHVSDGGRVSRKQGPGGSADEGGRGREIRTKTKFERVDERDVSALSYETFVREYAIPGQPVIIRNGARRCFRDGHLWDRTYINQQCGDKMVPVRRWVPGSVSWARLEEAGQLKLSDVLKTGTGNDDCSSSSNLDGSARAENGVGAERTAPVLYLHDWSLPQNLEGDSAMLRQSFQVPNYFAGDLLQRVANRGLPYTDSWPSLFFGPRGTRSDTHVDSFGSHFWMALLEGEKRWLLFSREDAPLLYPIWTEGSHDPVFDADVEEPDTTRHPAAVLARGQECVLEKGDLLFVPAGSPHRVENLTDTLALSCNYLDATNISDALLALDEQALTDGCYGSLASALRKCDWHLCRDQKSIAWQDLKVWPRSSETVEWNPLPSDPDGVAA